jgi:organic hydroperoxide reductase OsmC/OhrA
METKKTYKVFRYGSEVRWEAGRRGEACSSGKPGLKISSPPEFKGDPGFWTPEDLFIASVNACTMMTFLAYAQHKGLELAQYESEAEGVLENVEGKYRFTEVTVRPHVIVKSADAVNQAREILDSAHRNCLVSNSTTAEVKMFPQIHAT